MDNLQNTQICPACSMKFINNHPYPSWGRPITKEEVKKRICYYAKDSGCINDYTGKVTKD